MSSSVHDYASPTPIPTPAMDMTEVLVARLTDALDIKAHFHREASRYSRAMESSITRVIDLRGNTEWAAGRAALSDALDILREERDRAAD